jgi:uncharacterized membrane protein YkoI
MIRTQVLPAAMAAFLALSASGVALASSDEHENAKEISAVLNAKTSLAQAIATAEAKAGGRAMKVNVEHESGTYQYEVKIVAKDKVSEVFIDPASGKVTRTDDEGLIAKVFDKEDQEEFAKLSGSPVSLSTAVATAEKETGGKAVEAAFESEDGKAQYEVELANGATVRKVVVDGTSGKVVKTSASEEREHEED